MGIIKNKNTRALILIMSALVVLGTITTRIYYTRVNNSIDPRVLPARNLYEKYNLFAQNNQFDSVLYLMDTIEQIYSSTEHYKNSFETGVLYNNRSATYLTMALFSKENTNDSILLDSLVSLSEKAALKSIEIYTNWLQEYDSLNADEILDLISSEFLIGMQNYSDKHKAAFLKKRIKEIIEAQIETPRRISVSYTNMGIIYRYKHMYEEAARYYKTAIDLWDRNLTAENNLNLLLGRPLTKRNFIQKMFPPKRK